MRTSRFRPRNKKRFVDLARNKRADMVFDIKHRIRAGKYSNFCSMDYLDEGVSWSDIYFLGRSKFVLWNATIQTSANAYRERRHEAAFNLAWDELTPEEHADRGGWLVSGHDIKYEKFNQRTLFEQVRYNEEQLKDFAVFEEVKLDRSYRFGIGLNAVIDVELLTPEVLTEFVKHFLANGEREWVSKTSARLIGAPVIIANALVF